MMPETVDQYLSDGCGRCALGGTPQCKVHSWPKALQELRRIANACGLTEEIKWGVPCYTLDGKNILNIAAFKEYAALSFFKGALLKDPRNILEKPGENSQAGRLLKFTDPRQVADLEKDLKAYIFEAIEVEKQGLKVDFKAKNELEYPEELIQKFGEAPELQEAFEALTPGRQRGYILHFSQPKQSATRTSRIEKCVEKILAGKGFHDR